MEIQSTGITQSTNSNSDLVETKQEGFGQNLVLTDEQNASLSELLDDNFSEEFCMCEGIKDKVTNFIKKELGSIFGKEEPVETSMTDCVQIPGHKPFKEVIHDFIKAGDDGKIGEKELQNGLAQFSLYQIDENALKVYQRAYESTGSVPDALAAVRDQGLMSSEDMDWVNSYTRFASEFDRKPADGDENRIAVSLSDSERYDFDDAITWAEANLAHVVHGNYEIESVPVAVNDAYLNFKFDMMSSQISEASALDEEDKEKIE